jgi:hypothetical protein
MLHDEGAVISVCLEHYQVIENAIREATSTAENHER